MACRLLLAAFAATFACACGRGATPASFSEASGRFKRGQETFLIVPPPAPWKRVDSPGGDLAWLHPDENAVMAVNAACKGHGDPPLPILMNDLLIGTTDRRVLMGETVTLDGREALHQVVSVRVDGVPVIYDLYVIKKDGCVYDLTLVTPPRAYERASAQFVTLVAGFRGGVQ